MANPTLAANPTDNVAKTEQLLAIPILHPALTGQWGSGKLGGCDEERAARTATMIGSRSQTRDMLRTVVGAVCSTTTNGGGSKTKLGTQRSTGNTLGATVPEYAGVTVRLSHLLGCTWNYQRSRKGYALSANERSAAALDRVEIDCASTIVTRQAKFGGCCVGSATWRLASSRTTTSSSVTHGGI